MDQNLDDVRRERVLGRMGRSAPWLGIDTVLVRCLPGGAPLAPLLEARRRLLELVGIPPWDPHRVRVGLRRRLLGETSQTVEHDLVEDLNQAWGRRPSVVLVLECVEHADPHTVAVLRRARAEAEWLDVPVLALFHSVPTSGPPAVLAQELGVEAPANPVPEPVPPAARLVLRAAAHVGPMFRVDDVGQRLGWSPLEVLVALQQAVDHGEPIADHGGGILEIAPARVMELRQGTLPSLRARWEAEEAAPRPTPPPPPAPEPEVAESEVDDWVSQVTRFAAASRAALESGAAVRAEQLATAALQLVERRGTEEHRVLRLAVMLELAEARWRAAGQSSTLDDARIVVDAALDEVHADDPAGLRAGLLATSAAIRYDLGEPEVLSEALDQLVEAGRLLQELGEPLAAAALLDDQAAVWIRLGDPVRATHLLRKSREVFAAVADEDASAKRELAQTEHLLAKLPFHVQSRPDLEVEALGSALEHAHTAARLYEELGDGLAAARVQETEGRLLARQGDVEGASTTLTRAARRQQELHDALGLARTAAALAELFASRGQVRPAARMLSDSIRLNLQVGTPLGLAYNREGLEFLVRALPTPEARPILGEVEDLLAQAEQILGRADLPG